jgi:hypothetical protein
MRPLLGSPRYANVTSTLALVVALGGTGAYAANTIGSADIRTGAVHSSDIGTGQVKGADLAPNAVTSAKVRNGTLSRLDFKPGELPAGIAGPAGLAGPAGPTGPIGPTGAGGPPGISGWEVVVVNGAVLPTDTQGEVDARCPAGKTVMSGGFATFNANIQVLSSTVLGDVPGGRWIVDVKPDDGATFGGGAAGSSVIVRIVCAKVTP